MEKTKERATVKIVRLQIEIEFGLEFNQSEERKYLKFSKFCFDWSNFNIISIFNLIRA